MNTGSENRYHVPDQRPLERLEGRPLASFSARASAFLLDGGIVAALLLIPKIWTAMTVRVDAEPLSFILDFGALAGFVVTVLYFGLSTWIGKGATPGKRLLGIRVVSLVHHEITLWHSIERALGYFASSLEAGFGFLQYYIHPNRQTVHDRIAETIVVVDARHAERDAGAPA